ncbi:MAG: hypothetical protein H8E66_27595 [Planctomycetes bacterium]|nr:hypothetical protein [Planctomycetota bacterium]
MYARTSKPAQTQASGSTAALLLELEMPKTTAFEAFENGLEAELLSLEERFSGFVTRNSLAGAIGR